MGRRHSYKRAFFSLTFVGALGLQSSNSQEPPIRHQEELPLKNVLHFDEVFEQPIVLVEEHFSPTEVPEETAAATRLPPRPTYFPPPNCDEDEIEVAEIVHFGDWLGYKGHMSDMTWIPGSGDGLGIISLESFPVNKLGDNAELQWEFNLHFLDGPASTDLPPRVFDIVLGYSSRHAISDSSMLSISYSFGFFTDFEGSARKGVRFPGHFVIHSQCTPEFATVFGIEVLDRDDISVLPVVGVVLKPDDTIIYEIVFPQPRIQWRWSDSSAFYVGGELGGGTWAIERDTLTNDNATLRDIRAVAGWLDYGETTSTSFEFGYVFERSLEYRSGIGNYEPDNAWILRWRTHY